MDLKNQKILIIEDDHDVRLATRENLESAGYKNIAEAENGEVGLARLREGSPALVLLDRKMPGKDGLQVLDDIKEIYGDDIEVIMLTAYRDKSYITEAMRKGAFYYLVKDEDPDFHLHIIEKALRYHQKSVQRKAIEREIYELLIDNDDLVKNGYDFVYFKNILRKKIGALVDGVITTTMTDCAECSELVCQGSERACLPPQFGAKLLSSALGEHAPLFVIPRDSNNPFFIRALTRYVESDRRHEVQALVYVPFIDHSSPPIIQFLQENKIGDELMGYCCFYIFSDKTLKLTPEEKRLLRGFFDRFLIAMRIAKLVDKINSLNRNRLLGEMAAMVVHQISPLIAPLINCLQEPEAKKQTRGLAMIKDLQRLVEEFREFSNGLVKDYQYGRHEVTRLIQKAETVFFLEMDHAIDIQHEFPDQPVLIYGDAERLQQVFLNLFINAAQAIADARQSRGRIDIQIMTRENLVEVHIRDNGAGVPAALVPKLFGSYVSTKTGGMGLGLSLANEILRRHRGKIEYNPRYADGAEFIVTLPFVTAELRP
jgi:signal transduction histidine kinase/FixJ family two-component response regulator